MPEWVTQHYRLSGSCSQYIWSEQEMAEALEISVEELVTAIGRGEYGYHAHPLATKGGYEFNDIAYNSNLKRKERRG